MEGAGETDVKVPEDAANSWVWEEHFRGCISRQYGKGL